MDPGRRAPGTPPVDPPMQRIKLNTTHVCNLCPQFGTCFLLVTGETAHLVYLDKSRHITASIVQGSNGVARVVFPLVVEWVKSCCSCKSLSLILSNFYLNGLKLLNPAIFF